MVPSGFSNRAESACNLSSSPEPSKPSSFAQTSHVFQRPSKRLLLGQARDCGSGLPVICDERYVLVVQVPFHAVVRVP